MSNLEKTKKNTDTFILKSYAKNISIIFFFIMLLATMCVVFVLPTISRDNDTTFGLWSGRDEMSTGGIALLIIDLVAIVIVGVVMLCFRKIQTVPDNNKWFNISLIVGMVTFFLVLLIGVLSNPEWFSDADIHGVTFNLLFKLSSITLLEVEYTVAGLVFTIMCSIALGCTYILYAFSFVAPKQKTVSVSKKAKSKKAKAKK